MGALRRAHGRNRAMSTAAAIVADRPATATLTRSTTETPVVDGWLDHAGRRSAGAPLAQARRLALQLRGALWAPLPCVPIIGCLTAVAVYAAPAQGLGDLPSSALLVVWVLDLLLAWLALACVCLAVGAASPARANADSYAELSSRIDELHARLGAAALDLPGDRPNLERATLEEAALQLRAATAELRREGAEWARGTGYVAVWKRVHRAEEALLALAPPDSLLAEARYDRLRLANSTVDNWEDLLEQLQAAMPLVARAPCAGEVPVGGEELRVGPAARAALRHVRKAINDFRDDRRAGLVRARNTLANTTMVTALGVYALLWLAIVGGMAPRTLLVAASFFVVGAIVGLFNRLHGEAGTDTVVDDYGLSWARLVTTAMLSGVAAVMGVVLVHMAAATQAAAGPSGSATLASAFDLELRPNNLFVAAAFGFAPGMLVERLKRQSDAYRDDLKSSQATGGQPAAHRRRRAASPGP
jgi:hypothetical protein